VGSFVRSFRIIKTRSAARYSAVRLLHLSRCLSSSHLRLAPSRFSSSTFLFLLAPSRRFVPFSLPLSYALRAISFPRPLFRTFCVRFFLSLSLSVFSSRAVGAISLLPSAMLRTASGPFVRPFPFQFCQFSRTLALLAPSLSVHSELFRSLPRARSPAERASEVFLNRSTTGGCAAGPHFSPIYPKSPEWRN